MKLLPPRATIRDWDLTTMIPEVEMVKNGRGLRLIHRRSWMVSHLIGAILSLGLPDGEGRMDLCEWKL